MQVARTRTEIHNRYIATCNTIDLIYVKYRSQLEARHAQLVINAFKDDLEQLWRYFQRQVKSLRKQVHVKDRSQLEGFVNTRLTKIKTLIEINCDTFHFMVHSQKMEERIINY